MVFWQLTIDANDPARLARFWRQVMEYEPVPPTEPDTTWWRHYRDRLGDEPAFADRLFDPTGRGPAIWFQPVLETKAGKNRLHLDLYPTGRDNALTQEQRVATVCPGRRAARTGRHHRADRARRQPARPRVLRGPARPRGQRVLRQLTRSLEAWQPR